jgi:MHS family proline/betaine transporter-like MFS transporter
MAVPTFLVGLLPGYETIGIAAPVLLTLLRMFQGLSVGGEATTSMIFLVEQAPPGRRGLVGSFCSLAANGGFLLGSAIGAAFAELLPGDALADWGWRIPFLLGIALGVAGWWIRKVIVEEVPARAHTGSPLVETVRHHGGAVMRVAGIAMFNAVGFYVMFLYVVTWLQTVDGISPARALEINTVSMLFLLPVMLLSGWLSDRIGRRPLMFTAMILGLVAAWPCLWLMHHPDPGLILVGQLILVIPAGMGLGIMPAILTEAVAGHVRCTAVSLGYNIAFGVIGGLTPLTAAWLIDRTGMDLSPSWLFMGAALISIATLLTLRETSRDETLPS